MLKLWIRLKCSRIVKVVEQIKIVYLKPIKKNKKGSKIGI